MVESESFRDVSLAPTILPNLTAQGHAQIVKCCTLHKTLRSSIDVWEYDPGEFDWRIDADHSACVLSGRAEVSLGDGRCVDLEPGAAIYLPRGVLGRFVVKETLRTVAVRDS